MTNSEDLQRDIEAALSDVQRLRGELLEFSELGSIEPAIRELRMPLTDDLNEFRIRVAHLLDRIHQLLREIGSLKIGTSKEGSAFSLSTLANELNAQLEWLKGILGHLKNLIQGSIRTIPEGFVAQIAGPVRAALNKIETYIAPMLKRFLSKIWQIISNLITPKEWKLQGKVGTGILGLADVGIEITFGP